MEKCLLSDGFDTLRYCFVTGTACDAVHQFANLVLTQDEYYFTDEEYDLCLLYLEDHSNGSIC